MKITREKTADVQPLKLFQNLMDSGTTWESFIKFLSHFYLLSLKAVASIACDLSPRLGTLKAAKFLHAFMLWAIFRAPLLFFDTTPVGRVLSRFSKDIDALDVALPELISDGIYCFFEVTKISFNHA